MTGPRVSAGTAVDPVDNMMDDLDSSKEGVDGVKKKGAKGVPVVATRSRWKEN